MCLLVVAWRVHPRYRLVVAANRDEFHARAATPMSVWPTPSLLGGRDVQAGGTWLAHDHARRFGVITNFRELARPRSSAPSRGRLIVDYLTNSQLAWDYANELEADAMGYAGFSLLLADRDDLVYLCNRAEQFARRLPPGVYGLSNHLLDTPWPKLLRVRAALSQWIEDRNDDLAPLWSALADRTVPNNYDPLPELTLGIEPKWARVVASPFVHHPEYGTRCSTLSLTTDDGALKVWERRFDATGTTLGESRFDIPAGVWPG